ncbi:19535_t:CDS:2, partial [Funneliformis geosporum]
MDNCIFLPLEIIPKHQFVPAQSIKVTEIPLDATDHRIRTVFSKLGKIIRLTMDTKNLWQQATITDSADSNFDNIKKDINFSSSMTWFITGKQLIEIG